MDEWVRRIVGRASSLEERLRSPDLIPDTGAAVASPAAERLSHWRTSLTNDEVLFVRRLAWEGLTPETAHTVLRDVRLRRHASLPTWAQTLHEVLQLSNPVSRDRSIDAQAPVPFEEVLLPFVRWARWRCQAAARDAALTFEPSALAALEHRWLEWLSGWAARTLWLELQLTRLDHGSPLDKWIHDDPPRNAYRALVDRLRDDGLLSFFLEYSVLARVLATGATLCADAGAEMILRFSNDAEAVGRVCGIPVDGARVNEVSAMLSDPHHGLRSVAVLTLTNGARVVYKPRSLAIEEGFYRLLHDLEGCGAPIELRRLRVVDRGAYGWVEFADHAACADRAAAHRYFERAGALLALAHLLGGTDLHAGNVVASGEHPVLVDLETLLTPDVLLRAHGGDATLRAAEKARRSVMSTYLLPCRVGADAETFDIAAFCDASDQGPVAPQWADINTDLMHLEMLPLDGQLLPRAVGADGQRIPIASHAGALVSGFAATYRFVVAHRPVLLAADSSFMRLGTAVVRFVQRNTSSYDSIVDELRSPDLLREGIERSLHLEQLAVAALAGQGNDGRDEWIAIWRAERDAMEQGDVPHFSAPASSLDLGTIPGRCIKTWFTMSGHAVAVQRLQSLDQEDLAFQVDVIRTSLGLHSTGGATAQRRLQSRFPMPPTVNEHDEDLWLREVVAIAGVLERSAVAGDDGSLAWLQPRTQLDGAGRTQTITLAVAGHDLYDGALGIALFFAAAHVVTGRPGLSSVAGGATQSLIKELHNDGASVVGELDVGGLTGIGSLVYGLVALHRLLGEPRFLTAAGLAASLITVERLDAADSVDVTSGAGGALLGLLALYRVVQDPATLIRARHAARRIIEALEPAPGGTRAARTLDGRFLVGFSHGAAGLAYALARLHSACGDEDALVAAKDLWAFESAMFDEERADWPDLRAPGHQRSVSAWCHGAPGLALARLGSSSNINDAITRRDVDRALDITSRAVAATDHLCCGEFGLVDVLASGASELRRPQLRDAARRRASAAVRRAQREAGYALPLPSNGHLRSASLFRGESGIGYVLLRLLAPRQLPDVLRLC
jgi:type 2 lantibiotic biosynthesis protein LanM